MRAKNNNGIFSQFVNFLIALNHRQHTHLQVHEDLSESISQNNTQIIYLKSQKKNKMGNCNLNLNCYNR